MTFISKLDRERVSMWLARMRKLIDSGTYHDMTHEEAYDAVYRGSMHPDHKADRLANIARIVDNS